MLSLIYKLEEVSGEITKVAEYTLTPKDALRNYIMQELKGDPNWWTYPETVEGMREADGNRWYYDAIKIKGAPFDGVLAAYPHISLKGE